MKSLRFHECGAPAEVLRLEEVELPPLAEGSVEFKILASPINPADLNFIEGTYGVKPQLPSAAGGEGCGEVVASRSPDFKPGDPCLVLTKAGLWAERLQLPASQLLKLPAGIDPRQAAMLKVNPATAWRLLTSLREIPRGAWIIQNAANSGVGRCVIQLAKTLGIRTINLVRRPELIPQLLMLGADHVLVDDEQVRDSVKAISGGMPPVLAFNAVGGESALRLMNCLAPGGIHVTYGAMAKRPLTVPNGLLIFKDIQIRGLWVSRWIESAPRAELEEVYGRLAAAVVAGDLRIAVDSVYPLHEFDAALARLGDPGRNGKLLFEVGAGT